MILFWFVANPYTIRFINSVVSKAGLSVANAAGCPTTGGLWIAAFVFFIIVRVMMMF
jgi:hypothetical protein